MSLKNSVTPPGIDPGTVRLVEQRLNHYATPVVVMLCLCYIMFVLYCAYIMLCLRYIMLMLYYAYVMLCYVML